MKVLVTGASGFIGRSLCPYLIGEGNIVVPMARSHLEEEKSISNCDATWKQALLGCNSVIHLAGIANGSNGDKQIDLQDYREVNVKATGDLANRAIKAGVQRFIFMSTIKVNGEKTLNKGKFSATDQPNPQSNYAISKWEAEQELFEISSKNDLEVVVIRPPLVYGPGVKGNFASLIKLVQTGLPLPFGSVNNKRSMIALENLMSVTALCADTNNGLNLNREVFLVSDNDDISTAELLKKIAIAFEYKNRLIPFPVTWIETIAKLTGKVVLSDSLFSSLAIDISKTKELLGWTPQVSMDEQLKKMAHASIF